MCYCGRIYVFGVEKPGSKRAEITGLTLYDSAVRDCNFYLKHVFYKLIFT
jgi:hypothetical protein